MSLIGTINLYNEHVYELTYALSQLSIYESSIEYLLSDMSSYDYSENEFVGRNFDDIWV